MVKKQIQIDNHILLFKHEKLNEKSSEEILKKYNISPFQLPKIYKKDPTLKSMEVKSGDVIEIERNSPTANKVKYYRVVVDG
ncbi:MAG: DNA-directed RNA polymerase subunit H [Nanoarchaeota archaeon]